MAARKAILVLLVTAPVLLLAALLLLRQGIHDARVLGAEHYYGTRVAYYEKPLAKKQEARLIIHRAPRGSIVCASIYSWLPSGDIALLGKSCSRSGSLRISMEDIREYLETWRGSLISHGDDVAVLEPGLIVLVAVNKPEAGVYAVIRAVPLDVEKVLGDNASIAIDMDAKSAVRIPLEHSPGTESLSPGLSSHAGYWRLVGVVAERLGAYVPIIVARLVLSNNIALSESPSIVLGAKIRATDNSKVGFIATYCISPPGKSIDCTEHGLAGPVYVIRKSGIYLGFTALFQPRSSLDTLIHEGLGGGSMFSKTTRIGIMGSDLLLAMGIKADIALARYCLALPRPIGNQPCLGYAYLVLIRPVLEHDQARYWAKAEKFPSQDPLTRVYEAATRYWNRTDYGYYRDIFEVYLSGESHVYESLAPRLAIPVASLLLDNNSKTAGKLIALGLGYIAETKPSSLLHIEVVTSKPRLYIHPVGFYAGPSATPPTILRIEIGSRS